MSTDINISNYEDYLYSYVDGELQAEEISALERFLEMHPQFRSELDLLMATRLQPEAMVFDNKASLYRGSEISLQNYESYLLSYIDGELNLEEKAAFEQFISQHSKVKQELLLWQATKLQADPAVHFENKSVLYRKSNRRIEIRPVYWWATAAVVAGALFFLKLSDSTTETVDQSPLVAVQQPVPASSNQQPVVKTPELAEEKVAPVTIAAVTKTRERKPVEKVADKTTGPALVAAADTRITDITNISTEKPVERIDNKAIAAEISQQIKQVPGSEVAVNSRPSIDVAAPPASLATPAPAAEPGELIMSVTGNGLESKVLDKVTNVARFFARKRNK